MVENLFRQQGVIIFMKKMV